MRYTLEIIVFLCGAAVMIIELVGSRVLAPYVGTSIFVWTSLIGVILGSLSLGYWYGGKISDRYPNSRVLALIIFSAGIYIALIALIKFWLLLYIIKWITDIRGSSIIAALVLFCPPSVLLGMVSPYAVKLKLRALAQSGATVGNLYALSTIGSIAGTFLAGFWLIPSFGITAIMYGVAVGLIIVAALTYGHSWRTKILGAIIIVIIFTGHNGYSQWLVSRGFVETDTQYAHVLIFNDIDKASGQPVRRLNFEGNSQAAMFLNSDELVYEYTKYYDLAAHFKPGFTKALMIGGGAYSYPKHYLTAFPEATLDVVEIDPQLTYLARQYFRLEDNPRLHIYHADGRIFLNRSQEKYDVIFNDAYRSTNSIPYQLTTREAVQRMYDILADDGVALVNIISAIEGERGQFLRAEYRTFKSIFPQVYLFYVSSPQGEDVQNLILVALKNEQPPSLQSSNPKFKVYLGNLWQKELNLDEPILTDEYAPVDKYIAQLL
ncbi:MAG: fused MFS/spermidine synthase [Patescibacteria group bacterium]